MSILLITDTQLGMALKNIKFGKWTEKALNWSDALDPSEKELKNLNKFLQFTNEHKPDFIIHTGDIVNEIDKPNDLSNYKSFVNNIEYKINHVPGNHDVGIDSDKLSREGLDFYHKHFGNDFYNFQWNDFELFFLNSSIFINYENKDFYNQQIDFIKQTLSGFSSNKRIIIFTTIINIPCNISPIFTIISTRQTIMKIQKSSETIYRMRCTVIKYIPINLSIIHIPFRNTFHKSKNIVYSCCYTSSL